MFFEKPIHKIFEPVQRICMRNPYIESVNSCIEYLQELAPETRAAFGRPLGSWFLNPRVFFGWLLGASRLSSCQPTSLSSHVWVLLLVPLGDILPIVLEVGNVLSIVLETVFVFWGFQIIYLLKDAHGVSASWSRLRVLRVGGHQDLNFLGFGLGDLRLSWPEAGQQSVSA